MGTPLELQGEDCSQPPPPAGGIRMMPGRLPQITTEVQEGGGWEARTSEFPAAPHPHTQVCLPILSISDGWLRGTPSKLGYAQLQTLNQVQASVSLESTFPAVSSMVFKPHGPEPIKPSNLSLLPVSACSDHPAPPHPLD